ncbi:MAG: DUF3405 domain-containing protein [Azospirillaceae bacterium]
MADTVVLYLTHFIDDQVIAEVARLRAECGDAYDVRILLNINDDHDPDPDRAVPATVITETDRRALPYPSRNSGRYDSTQPGGPDLAMLAFRARHPHYKHYWLIEYDVRFTGDWRALFDHFADDDAALLATTLHHHATNPRWHHWRSIAIPQATLAEGGEPRRIRGFFPFYRLSAEGAECLDSAMRAGWDGIYEVTWPTILAHAGLVIEDIGGDGPFVRPENVNRFYQNNPGIDTLAPGTFVYRPMLRRVRETARAALWHPVKKHKHNHPLYAAARGLYRFAWPRET